MAQKTRVFERFGLIDRYGRIVGLDDCGALLYMNEIDANAACNSRETVRKVRIEVLPEKVKHAKSKA